MTEKPPARVTFYVLPDADPASRLAFACRLAEKVYKLKQRIHAQAQDVASARNLDDLLWTFRQGSFVPHEIYAGNGTAAAPITIGSGATEGPEADLLINLADDVPAFFGRYARIAEIIDGSAGCRERGRLRHRFYKEQGLETETHEVS